MKMYSHFEQNTKILKRKKKKTVYLNEVILRYSVFVELFFFIMFVLFVLMQKRVNPYEMCVCAFI